tara:strand:- start:304 stop:555 length:252 start_codon:yes stop_codon:yes gene_type:complete
MKLIKGLFKWLGDIVKETIAQVFTILGFFIAWLTLTGPSKDIVGIAILGSITLWLLTIGLRKEKKDVKKEKETAETVLGRKKK